MGFDADHPRKEALMIEAIVTMVFPATEKFEPGTGALLSRDRIVEDEPAHTRVYRMEFDTLEDAEDWLAAGCVAAREQLVGITGN